MQDFTFGTTTYKVKRIERAGKHPFFILTGPHGAEYGLLHYRDSSDEETPIMYAINATNFRRSTPFRSVNFIEENGSLKTV